MNEESYSIKFTAPFNWPEIIATHSMVVAHNGKNYMFMPYYIETVAESGDIFLHHLDKLPEELQEALFKQLDTRLTGFDMGISSRFTEEEKKWIDGQVATVKEIILNADGNFEVELQGCISPNKIGERWLNHDDHFDVIAVNLENNNKVILRKQRGDSVLKEQDQIGKLSC